MSKNENISSKKNISQKKNESKNKSEKVNIRVLIPQEEIKQIVKDTVSRILRSHDKQKALHFVIVLEGGKYFAADIIRELKSSGFGMIIQDFIKLKSYEGTNSTGKITVHLGLQHSVVGEDIIILEDIVDTGRSMDFLKNYLIKEKANSVRIATFLDKPSRRIIPGLKIDFIGKEIPNLFVIGYGMDFDEQYRELPYVGVIE